MSAYFEIGFAASAGRLCFLTGTGFSKAVTEGAAPGWQQLLEYVCDTMANGDSLKRSLFPAGATNPLSLEEAAQVIALELKKLGWDIHNEIAHHIKQLQLAGENKAISDFFNQNPTCIVTTNYDKLAEQLSDNCVVQTITPGFPIPRAPADVQVYHIHGSVDAPPHMVVTSEDYFRFMHSESYFSRKPSTVLTRIQS